MDFSATALVVGRRFGKDIRTTAEIYFADVRLNFWMLYLLRRDIATDIAKTDPERKWSATHLVINAAT